MIPFDAGESLRAAGPEAGAVALALAALVLDAFAPRSRSLLPYAAAAGLAGLVAVAAAAPDAGPAFDGAIAADPLGRLARIVVLGATAVFLAAWPSYARSGGVRRVGEATALVLLAAAGASLLSVATDLLVAVLALETAAVATYAAITLRGDERSAEAAVKYFAVGAVASAFLLAGVSYVWGAAGSTRYAEVARALGEGPLPLAGAGLVLVGLGFKVGIAPFHAWLPDAYDGAPTAVTAFMASAVKAAALVALVRIVAVPFAGLDVNLAGVLVSLSAITMVWGNLAAFRQESPKRLLAWSAVAHSGYLAMGLAAAASGAGEAGVRAAVLYVAAYAPLALGAFVAVAAAEGSAGGADLAGLSRRSPALAAATAVLMAALAGLPPTLGFVGKIGLFAAAVEAGLVGLALVGVATSVVAAAYYLRVARLAYADAGDAPPGAAGPVLAGVAVGAAAVALAAGCFPEPLVALAGRAAAALRMFRL